MVNTKRSFIVIFGIIIFHITIYSLFFRPYITTWGASEEEATMELIGDDLSPSYSSTRAIVLKAPISRAWQCIISLGADRGGFYNYAFMEDMAGYVGNTVGISPPKIYDMPVGRIVPGSLDESGAFIKTLIKKYDWEWEVVAVDPGKSFVLSGWGAFVLKEITPSQTRLIVRTHEENLPGLGNAISRFVMIALHYIMERRMMIGFQAVFEPDLQPYYISDIMWFFGLVLSFFGMVGMVFMYRGIPSVAVPTMFGLFWLFVLFVLNPRPQYSLMLSAVIVAMMGRHLYRKRQLTLLRNQMS